MGDIDSKSRAGLREHADRQKGGPGRQPAPRYRAKRARHLSPNTQGAAQFSEYRERDRVSTGVRVAMNRVAMRCPGVFVREHITEPGRAL